MSQAQRETMKLWDGEISYLEWMGAGPSLLFAHATGFNAETYRMLLQPLSDRFHIYAIDQRGHGFTSLPTEEGLAKDWIIYRDDLVRFLDGLDGRPMILAGHSMGATVSLMAALLRPDLVRGLVLIEPVFMPGSRFHGLLARWRMARRGDPNLAERAARRRDTFESLDFVESGYRGRGAFTTWPDQMVHDYLAGGLLPTEDGKVRLACAPAWESQTFRMSPRGVAQAVRGLKCPVTLIHAGQNSTCPEPEALRFVKNHRHTRRVLAEKATHFLPMEYLGVVQKEIARMAHRAPR
ncbi:MAG: alpha/beta hydrolase [Proteobacteria bacterium]|nr:alpha/beta hydrolase [Pseudomonadota bacterium]